MEHLADTRVLKTDLLEIWKKKCYLQQSSVEGSDSIGYLKKQNRKNKIVLQRTT